MNIVVFRMIQVAGTNYQAWSSETLQNPGTDDCSLADNRGGVYGFAIKLKNLKEKETFFKAVMDKKRNINQKITSCSHWNTIGYNYYPLYWGKDSNLGFRLREHTIASKSAASIQLCDSLFNDREIIYGAILCKDNSSVERELHEKLPDLLKNVSPSP